jgi:hypothetical protein
VRKVNLLQEAAKVPEYWGRITPLQFNDYDVHVNRIKASTCGTPTPTRTTSSLFFRVA